MILIYILYFVLFVIFLCAFAYRIIADLIEYLRCRPRGKEQPPDFDPAQITINRRESSALNSFAAWDIYLNGENIGSIKDGSSITVTASKQKNLLEAKGPDGAQSLPLEFFTESGCKAEVSFNNKKFQDSQGMSIVLPSDEGYARTRVIKKRWRALISWILMMGYYYAVYFVFHVDKYLKYTLPLLPIVALGFYARRPYLDLIDYLSASYPDVWTGISYQMSGAWNKNLIFYNMVSGDPDYLKLKLQYEGILSAQILSAFIYIASLAYVRIPALT